MIFQLGKGKNGNSADERGADTGGDPAFVQSGSGFALGTGTPTSGSSGTSGAATGSGGASAAETVRRWREAAAVARAAASEMIDPAGVAMAGGEISVGDQGQHSVEWPDPRAAITLNRPISQGVDPVGHEMGPAAMNPVASSPVTTSAVPAAPAPSKAEGLVSRTFPFFRSSSASPAAASQGSAHQSPQSALGSQGASGSIVQQNSQQVQNPMSQQTMNPVGAAGSLAGPFAGAPGDVKGAGWKAERQQGVPGDLTSALKGRSTQLPPEEEIRVRFGTNIKSALGPGTIIEGKFRFDSPVSIEGTLIGEVFSNSVLIVGAQANVTAKITVGSLIVLGKVHGDVECEELLEIKSTGYLEGDIRSKRIAIDDGGYFRGLCTPAQRTETLEEEEG